MTTITTADPAGGVPVARAAQVPDDPAIAELRTRAATGAPASEPAASPAPIDSDGGVDIFAPAPEVEQEDPQPGADEAAPAVDPRDARIEALERRLGEVTEAAGLIAREVGTQKQQQVRQYVGQLQTAQAGLSQKIEEQRAARRAARDSGDSAAEDRADEAIYQLRQHQDRIAAEMQRVTRAAGPPQRTTAGPAPQQQRQEQTAPAAQMPPLAAQWAQKHKGWFNPAAPDADTAAIMAHSASLAQRGIAITDPKHYQELDRYVASTMSHRVGGGRPAAQRGPAPSGRAATTGTARDLTPAQEQFWQEAGYNTKDPAIRKRLIDRQATAHAGRSFTTALMQDRRI